MQFFEERSIGHLLVEFYEPVLICLFDVIPGLLLVYFSYLILMILGDGQRTFCAEAVIGFLVMALMEPHMSPIHRELITGRNYTNLCLFSFYFP